MELMSGGIINSCSKVSGCCIPKNFLFWGFCSGDYYIKPDMFCMPYWVAKPP